MKPTTGDAGCVGIGMETIWKILTLAGVVSAAIFLQILSCFAFDNNW